MGFYNTMHVLQVNKSAAPKLLTAQSVPTGMFFHIPEECHGNADQVYLKTGTLSFVCFSKFHERPRVDSGYSCRTDECVVLVPTENVKIEFSL